MGSFSFIRGIICLPSLQGRQDPTSEHGKFVRLTDVDMSEERPIHGSTDGVRLILREQNLAAIIALVKGRQDVRGIVRPIAVCLDGTELCPFRWARYGYSGLVRRRHDGWPGRTRGGDASHKSHQGGTQ